MTYPNRMICDVLEEMRKCYETRNFSPLLGLIEEAQTMANRMESSLYDKRDIENWTEERNNLAREKKELQKEISNLKDQKKLLTED